MAVTVIRKPTPKKTYSQPYWLRKSNSNEFDNTLRDRNQQFYQSTKWRKVRILVLADYPVCFDCGINASEHVHHQLPLHTREGWSNRLNMFLDNGDQNLFGLCHSCHSKRTVEEQRAMKGVSITDRMNELNEY